MTTDELDDYAFNLCESIRAHYLRDYNQLFYGPYQGEGWPLKSVNSIYNFVLSRPGWICHHDRWGLFVYNNRYPIIINLQASGCAGVLMKDAAINIS